MHLSYVKSGTKKKEVGAMEQNIIKNMTADKTYQEIFGVAAPVKDATPHAAKLAQAVYRDVYKAMAGDGYALIRVNASYPDVKTLGQLNALGAALYAEITPDMREDDYAATVQALNL
jgi:hypothetical protein